MVFGHLNRNTGLPGILIWSQDTDRFLQTTIQRRSPTKAREKIKDEECCFPSSASSLPAEQSLRCFDLSSVEAHPCCWLCTETPPASWKAQFSTCLRAAETWIYESGERVATPGQCTISQHIHVASACPSLAWSKHEFIPNPRGETNCQQTPMGLGLLHITVAHLCFVCYGSQT